MPPYMPSGPATAVAVGLGLGAPAGALPAQEPQAVVEQQESSLLMDRLNATTAPYHEDARNSDFVKAMEDKSLTPAQFITHMQQRLIMHANLEGLLEAHSDNPLIAAVSTDNQRKTELAQQDLDYLQKIGICEGCANVSPGDALPVTMEFVAYLNELAATNPVALLGVEEVMYGGLQNGGPFIGVMIRDALNDERITSEQGTLYYSQARLPGVRGQQEFSGYVDRLDEITDEEAIQAIIGAAVRTYEFSERMSTELMQTEDSNRRQEKARQRESQQRAAQVARVSARQKQLNMMN